MKTPRWTILFDILSEDGYVSRARMFYDDGTLAEACYMSSFKKGLAPTKRPFNESDRPFLSYHMSEI